MVMTKNLGMVALSVYLILSGLSAFAAMSLGVVLPILAIIAGVLILIGK